MPIYDFECECGFAGDKFFSMADMPQFIKCPNCSGRAKKIITAARINRYGRADGIQDEHPNWLGPTVEIAVPEEERHECETRSGFEAWKKKHGKFSSGDSVGPSTHEHGAPWTVSAADQAADRKVEEAMVRKLREVRRPDWTPSKEDIAAGAET